MQSFGPEHILVQMYINNGLLNHKPCIRELVLPPQIGHTTQVGDPEVILYLPVLAH